MDCRGKLVNDMAASLTRFLDAETASRVLDILAVRLGDYEVTERSTDIAVIDNTDDAIVKNYIGCLLVEGRAKGTVEEYVLAINQLRSYTGKKLTDIGVYDIRRWLAQFKIDGRKASYIANRRNCINAFFFWMSSEDIINKNPCDGIKPIKKPYEEKKAFTDEEIDAIRFSCESVKERAVIEFLLSSGVRVQECCNMLVSDVDLNRMVVTVRQGKGGKDRTAFITPVAKRHIYIYLSDAKHKSEYLFTSNYDGKYSTSGVGEMMRKLSKKCGFHVHPHRFRRTLATELARKGMPIQEIQKLLGHNSIETTRRYTETKIDKVQASYKQYIA